ncbi:MAG: hypothetical protein ACI8QS_002849 [Planctomycetota bacterium]
MNQLRQTPKLALALALACCLGGTLAQAQDVQLTTQRARWRFETSYFGVEGADEKDGDEIGLFGIHYDILGPIELLPELYVGVGGYGAYAGDRGGLFIGGLNAGWLHPLSPLWSVDAGLFAGGGGGGDGPESEGLVLRPHVAIERNLGMSAIRFEIAHIDIKDDPINDFHVALGISLNSEVLRAAESGRRDAIPDIAVVSRQLRVTPLVQIIDPSSSSKESTSDNPFPNDVSLLGIGIDYFLGDHLYIPFEAFGAAGGQASGYASVYTGLGWAVPLIGETLALEVEALVGSSGGGRLDVAGGFSWQSRAGLRAHIGGPISLVVMAGYLDAPNGSFQGGTLTGGLTWSANTPTLTREYPRSRLENEGLPRERARVKTTRFQILNKTYTPISSALTRKGGPYDKTINLVGIGFEQPILGDFSLMGRAYTAWEGDVGGYGEGLFGLKYEFAPLEDENHNFSLSMEGGAGGGGGMDVGSGLIWQWQAGWRYELTEQSSVSAEFGNMQPNHGTFEAETFQLGFTWNLNRAVLR